MRQSAERAELLKLASEIGREAGGLLRNKANIYRTVEHEFPRDLKLCGDRVLNSHISERLYQETQFPVLSEETPSSLDPISEDRPIWIVDPLDGSVNYAKGLQLGCVSVALWEKRTAVLGVIYDFYGDRLYTGDVDRGAALDGKPIRVSTVKTADLAVLGTGFPAQGDFSRVGIAGFVSAVKRFRKVRMLGTAAVSLALVAAGVLDAYYECNIRIWDVAAGVAMVKAAGGRCDVTPGSHSQSVRVFAANSELFHNEVSGMQEQGKGHGVA